MTEFRFGNLRFIPGLNQGRYPNCHSLFVEDTVCAVLDPGSHPELLKSLKAAPGVDVVLLSHYHEDHWLYLDLFRDAELWMPEADAAPLADLDLFLQWYGVNDPAEAAAWKQVIREQFHFEERVPERTFNDREVLELGSTRVEVIHAPGHTPGHSCFFFPEQELLFLADVDLSRFGPWYGDKYSEIDQFIASVDRLRKVPAKVYVIAHEAGVLQGDLRELWDSYLAVIDQREAELREFIREPRTIEQIIEARIVYKKAREPKRFYDFGERAIMQKHLERLMKTGKAVSRGGTYQLVR